MNRSFLVSIFAFAFILFGMTTQDVRLFGLALPLVLYLLAGLWHAPHEMQLAIQRSMSAWRIAQGETVQVQISVTNDGPDLEEVLLEDILPPGLQVIDGAPRHLFSLKTGQTESWTYTLGGKRGYYMLHQISATARDRLGLTTVSRFFPTDGQLFVVPPVLRLRRISIRPRRTRIFSGSIPARQGGPGLEFFDVREYQVGDPSGGINWRLSARHDGLYSNQYEQERVVDVGIILDGRRSTNEIGDRSIFEYSIMAAAALSNAFLSAGNRVGMLFYGKRIRWTMPGYGKIQGERILHDLSGLEPSDSNVLSELQIPHKRFPIRSQLVFISPLASDHDFETLAELRAKEYAVLVVSPDPVAFEAASDGSSEAFKLALRLIQIRRQLFLNRLRGIGIHVVNWDVSQPFEQVARRELERRQLSAVGL